MSVTASSAAALLHPPSIVHFNAADLPTSLDHDDDCSTISSAPNSPGRRSVGDSEDDPLCDPPPPPLPDTLQLSLYPSPEPLQRKNSELGRQSRKTRLRRASLLQIRQGKTPVPEDDPSLHHPLEEKKCDDSPASSVEPMLKNRPNRPCRLEEQRRETVPSSRSDHSLRRNTLLLDDSNCSTILPQNEEDSEDLPLLPRNKSPAVPPEYSTSSSATAATNDMTRLEASPQQYEDASPMDEVDELEYPTSVGGVAKERQSLFGSGDLSQQRRPLDELEPPSLQSPSLPLVSTLEERSLLQKIPNLVWKESESFDDDLMMSPTDELYDDMPTLDDPPAIGTTRGTASPLGLPPRSWNGSSNNNDEVPLDEQFLNMSLMPSHDDDNDDLPPIALIRKYSLHQHPSEQYSTTTDSFPRGRADHPGSDAANAIAVEDLVDWTNEEENDGTNLLDVSHDSSHVSAVGPLIRLEQHQPLLLQTDDISSSDETPLVGNGPVTRALGSSRLRNRMYGEPRLHGYWQSKHPSNQSRRRRAQRVSASNGGGKYNRSAALSHSSPNWNENSLDRMLPPLIVDSEQLRSIGVNAIMAVCNGIGSLFLSNGEASESPKEKKIFPSERYKLLTREEKHSKKRSRVNKYKHMARLASEDLSKSEDSSTFLDRADDVTFFSNVTPIYFEASLQRSIEAELKSGEITCATTSKSELVAIPVSLKEAESSLDQQFADFAEELNNIDIVDAPFKLKRTRSVPLTARPYSSEVVNQLWMEKVLAIKDHSKKSESVPVPDDERQSLVSPMDSRSTHVPEVEHRSRIPGPEQRSIRRPRVKSGIAERISALRGLRDTPTPKQKSSSVVADLDALESSLYSPIPATVSNVGRVPLLSPVTPVDDQYGISSISPIDHTPLAEPPPLRRLNVSVEIQDSFGPEFSTLDLDEPPSLVRSKKVVAETLSSPRDAEKPSADRSPMSDFLLLRLQASSSDLSSTDMQNQKTANTERTRMPYDCDESDCSSTEELVSSLDGLVKDLDGMANSRRIERRQNSDAQSSDFVSHDFHAIPETITPDLCSVLKSNDFNAYEMPLLADLLINERGIPNGDIMISLLSTDPDEPVFLSRVDESIWRSRTMRRQSDVNWLDDMRQRESRLFPTQRRVSVCVDVDDVRVMDGITKLADTQRVALEYLNFDDFDDALALYDDMCLSYEQFGDSLDSSDGKKRLLKRHLANAQFNLGIVHALRGEQDEAMDYFETSTQLFSESCGVRHVAHVTSLVRTAMCHFALEDYTTAFSELELALSLSRDGCQSLSDYHLVAEILNNLGCLSYMGGEIERAMSFFRQSMIVLTKAEGLALYSDSKFDSHSTMLGLSIVKSNIAFLSLTFYRDVTESVAMFESVIKDQQLLFRDNHATLTTTMEYLAAANLLAGHKVHALQLLRRVLRIQASGGDDRTDACQRTRHKIDVLEGKEDVEPSTESTDIGGKVLPILETSRESSNAS